MKKYLSLVAGLIVLVMGDVALAQPDAGLLELQNIDRRVATISYQLATRNTELCREHANWSGLTFHDLNQYGPPFRPQVSESFGLGEDNRPAILAMVKGSPADLAGLRENDTIMAINGVPLSVQPLERKASYRSIGIFNSLMEAALAAGEVEITSRDGAGTLRTAMLKGVPGCASRVEVGPGTVLNAGADGQIIQVSAALVDFVKSDDELAVLTAHEMAHNILHHRARLDAQKVSRGLLSGFGKNASRIKVTEVEADYVGLYLAARAGYDISAGASFWKRLGSRVGLGIFHGATHPSWDARQEMVRATIAEIAGKKVAGQPVVPDPDRIGR